MSCTLRVLSQHTKSLPLLLWCQALDCVRVTELSNFNIPRAYHSRHFSTPLHVPKGWKCCLNSRDPGVHYVTYGEPGVYCVTDGDTRVRRITDEEIGVHCIMDGKPGVYCVTEGETGVHSISGGETWV